MKRLILLLYLVFAIVSPLFAVVLVSSEEASFYLGVNEQGGLIEKTLKQGNWLIVIGCDVHDWRLARHASGYGTINLRDIELLFGALPDCDYVPSIMPDEELPDDVWENKPKLKYICYASPNKVA